MNPCLLAACVIALVVGLAGPAAAHTGSAQAVSLAVAETITLASDNWAGYTFSLAAGDSIAYAIQTVGVEKIDVYIVGQGGLTAYVNHATFQTLSAMENRSQFGGTYSGATGSVTVIVDNTNLGGAIPQGSVTVQVSLTKVGSPTNPGGIFAIDFALVGMLIGGIILVVVVLVIVIVVVSRRGKAPPLPPQPPYQQPYQAPGQPPYPPQGGNPPQGPYRPGP